MANIMTGLLGRNLRDARLEAKMSQQEVANKLGITRQTLIAYEKGSGFRSDILLAASRLFNRSPEWFFEAKHYQIKFM